MSNGTAVVEKIAQNVLETLQGVSVDIGEDSYSLEVVRYFKAFRPEHLTAAIFQLPGDNGFDGPTLTERRQVTFGIDVYIMPSKEDQTPFDAYYNQFAAQIETLLQADITRGGNALNTEIQPSIPYPPVADEFSGFTFNMNVTYEILLYRPFESARTY